jgi:CHAT domain-containing protein/Tfp pilus assembly protein PilF
VLRCRRAALCGNVDFVLRPPDFGRPRALAVLVLCSVAATTPTPAHAGFVAPPGETVPAELEAKREKVGELFGEKEFTQARILAQEAVNEARTQVGAKSITYAEALNDLGWILKELGELEPAHKRFVEGIAIAEVKGTAGEEIRQWLYRGIGRTMAAGGAYSDAIAYLKKAVTLAEKMHGADSDETSTARSILAEVQVQAGDPAGLAWFEASLKDTIAKHGEVSGETASRRLSFAQILAMGGQRQRADAEGAKVREILIKLKGSDDNWVADTYFGIGKDLNAAGEPRLALPFAEEAVRRGEKVYADDGVVVAQLYQEYGVALRDLSMWEPCVRAFEEESRHWIRGGSESDSVLEGNALNNQARCLVQMGQTEGVEPRLKKALAIWEREQGPNGSKVGSVLNNLAVLYDNRGDYYASVTTMNRVIEIWKAAHGPKSEKVAIGYSNLASMQEDHGEFSEAADNYYEAKNIWEATAGPNDPKVAIVLSNLGQLFRRSGQLDNARKAFERQLEIVEGHYGGAHPEVADVYESLGHTEQRAGNFAKALKHYEASLAVRDKALPSDHSDFSDSYNALGAVHYNLGNLDRSLEYYDKALANHEQNHGTGGPGARMILGNMTAALERGERFPEALSVHERAEEFTETELRSVFEAGTEIQKRLFANRLRGDVYARISLNFMRLPDDDRAERLALRTVLRRKGRVLDAVEDKVAAMRSAVGSDSALLDELASIRNTLARLTLEGRRERPQAEHDAELERLRLEVERLERDIGEKTKASITSPTITIPAVAAALPKDTALVELVQWLPFEGGKGSAEVWGEPRYAVYVLSGDDEVVGADLGQAAKIDAMVRDLRAAASKKSGDPEQASKQLYDAVLSPVAAALKGKKRLVIAPDGQLNLVPFAALSPKPGTVLLQDFEITYVGSGRELLSSADMAARGPAIVIGDPDFDTSGSTPTSNGSDALQGATFQRLPGTAEEAQGIGKRLDSATVRTEADATEGYLKGVRAPVVLHVATHGFFLGGGGVTAPSSRGLELSSDGDEAAVVEDPLLRSGLVMAGANGRSSGDDDGIVTALEVANLDLYGTRLVVLSACETGLGEVANGEGVYGLRRALVMAGAESQVMSLWKVDDAATRDLMLEYYRNLDKGKGRADALRQAQLNLMKKGATKHPFYWAAFIPSGEWSPMSFDFTATGGSDVDDDDDDDVDVKVKRRWVFGSVGAFVGQLAPASLDNTIGGGASGEVRVPLLRKRVGIPLVVGGSFGRNGDKNWLGDIWGGTGLSFGFWRIGLGALGGGGYDTVSGSSETNVYTVPGAPYWFAGGSASIGLGGSVGLFGGARYLGRINSPVAQELRADAGISFGRKVDVALKFLYTDYANGEAKFFGGGTEFSF